MTMEKLKFDEDGGSHRKMVLRWPGKMKDFEDYQLGQGIWDQKHKNLGQY